MRYLRENTARYIRYLQEKSATSRTNHYTLLKQAANPSCSFLDFFDTRYNALFAGNVCTLQSLVAEKHCKLSINLRLGV